MLRLLHPSSAGRTFAAGDREARRAGEWHLGRADLETRVPMKLIALLRFVTVLILACAVTAAGAQDTDKGRSRATAAERQETGKGVVRLLPADSVTEHSIDTARGKLAYTATAGTLAF